MATIRHIGRPGRSRVPTTASQDQPADRPARRGRCRPTASGPSTPPTTARTGSAEHVAQPEVGSDEQRVADRQAGDEGDRRDAPRARSRRWRRCGPRASIGRRPRSGRRRGEGVPSGGRGSSADVTRWSSRSSAGRRPTGRGAYWTTPPTMLASTIRTSVVTGSSVAARGGHPRTDDDQVARHGDRQAGFLDQDQARRSRAGRPTRAPRQRDAVRRRRPPATRRGSTAPDRPHPPWLRAAG